MSNAYAENPKVYSRGGTFVGLLMGVYPHGRSPHLYVPVPSPLLVRICDLGRDGSLPTPDVICLEWSLRWLLDQRHEWTLRFTDAPPQEQLDRLERLVTFSNCGLPAKRKWWREPV